MSVIADTNASSTVSAPNITDNRTDRPLAVELKNGKLVLKQKSLAFEKMSETMQEIVSFREMLEQRLERKDAALTAVPDDHRPLIAKMVHESDKTLQALAKHIQHELLPAQDDDDEEESKAVSAALSQEVVEKAVKSLATRTNYGLDASHASNGRVPASWQIWRWEVKDEFREWLPKASREKVAARLMERQQAKLDVTNLFLALPDADRNALVGGKTVAAGKGSSNTKVKAKAVDKEPDTTAHFPAVQGAVIPSPKLKKVGADSENDKEALVDTSAHANGVGRPKKPMDPEKVAKEKERQEKRQAKLDKEKKAKEAQNKSRNLMANFFGKTKAPLASGSGSRSGSISKDSPEDREGKPNQEVNSQSEFDRIFRPFVLKKDAELAPGNWFHEKLGNESELAPRELIVIENDEVTHHASTTETFKLDEDVVMDDASHQNDNPDRGQMTAEDRLHESLSSLHSSLRPPRLRYPPRRHSTFRSYHPQTVRATMQNLTEAEITGDVPTVRSLLSQLRNRSVFPAKVLIFHEDARPGYFGTWTRNSRDVGPRTPFSRDVVSLDYDVDSGEEWEEEEEGDVLDNEDEEDGAATEEPDSDLDSWLVDDDEAVEPGSPIDARFGSPDLFPPLVQKRKAQKPDESEVKPDDKKRKVVVPLVPFTKGPCWESKIGDCTYEPFNAHRIHIFNDTPLPIDPFTFVSAPMLDSSLSKTQPTETNSGFAVPHLPSRLSNTSLASSTSGSGAVPLLSSSAAVVPKRPAPQPKTSFPDAQMPILIAKIKELDTGNLTFIIESVYKDLSNLAKVENFPRIKKNAIEAKVKEVSEKDKKVWTVKTEIKALYGMA
ncbi:hypothetical protein BC835DRAFT_1549407 [Cytidiella melzeri]|nr:hypothetical protein BC835DRAFT_1549407 [Cytidiella melzeri]